MIKTFADPQYVEEILRELPPDTLIGEFSGRDSAAAIIKVMEQEEHSHLLPVASFAGTEYGDEGVLKENHEHTARRLHSLYGEKKNFYPLLFYSNPALWNIINGRFTSLVIEKYGFYTPCIGCHAYFHILRLPLALKLGKKIVSGERERHNGRLKVNQTPLCLDFYEDIISYFGAKLLLPLRHVHRGEEVEEILGWKWQEGKNHPDCVFSGNYRDLEGKTSIKKEQVQEYLEGFLKPVIIKVTAMFLENNNVSKEELLKEVENIL